MKIAYESNLLLPPISQAISFLTDRAKICLDDIQYDKAEGKVEIIMLRKKLSKFSKSIFGKIQPVYSQSAIKSLLIIRQVEEMSIKVDDRLGRDCNSDFTVLFGLRLNDNNLYIASVEEAQGDFLCQIHIKVGRINLELCDVEKI